MSKINPLEKPGTTKFSDEKLAGGAGMQAAAQDEYSLLRRVALANLLWEKNAYIDGMEIANHISYLIPRCNPEKVANLAIETRLVQKLRHTPLFIAAEMLKHKAHKPYVSEVLQKVITRADMLSDFLAIYAKQNGGRIKPIAAQAKKGLGLAFNNFNEYQLAKYDRGAAIKLRDVLFLTHAKPEQGKEELFKRIAERKLQTPDTWEVALSTGKNKKETWTRLITEGKIGGLAMLRNIRNMMDASVDKKIISKGLESLKSHMLLPLDFLKSARINPEFSREIEEAMIQAYTNLPKLPGRTLFINDVSGSMGHLTSAGSIFSRLDQSCAMAMLAANQCEDFVIVATAGNDSTRVHASEIIKYPKKGFDLFEQIVDTKRRIGGGGIFTRQCLEWCRQQLEGEFDRIIIFSDSQDCDNKNKTPKPFGKRNYIVDVSANKNGINYKGVWTAEISGWSEHFLTYIAAYEGLENKFQEQEEVA